MEEESLSLTNAFNTLLTNDREVLINQMGDLLKNHNVDKTTVIFYLELSSWNVPAAINTFYDNGCQLLQNINYSFQFIRDITIGEGEAVPPATPFLKSWLVKNNGQTEWPRSDLYLKFVSGDRLSAKSDHVRVAALPPGQESEIQIEMTSPTKLGRYAGQWRMSYQNYQFGESIWVVIEVKEGGVLGVMQQMESSMSWMDSSNNNNNKQVSASSSNSTSRNPFEIS